MVNCVAKPSMVWSAPLLLAVLLLLVTSWSVAQEGATVTTSLRGQDKNQESYHVLHLNLRSGLWPWQLAMFSESREHLQRITTIPVEMIVEKHYHCRH